MFANKEHVLSEQPQQAAEAASPPSAKQAQQSSPFSVGTKLHVLVAMIVLEAGIRAVVPIGDRRAE